MEILVLLFSLGAILFWLVNRRRKTSTKEDRETLRREFERVFRVPLPPNTGVEYVAGIRPVIEAKLHLLEELYREAQLAEAKTLEAIQDDNLLMDSLPGPWSKSAQRKLRTLEREHYAANDGMFREKRELLHAQDLAREFGIR